MFRLTLTAVLAALLVRIGAAQVPVLVDPNLVPARYQSVTDGQGRSWSVQQDGTIDSGNSFSNSGRLLVAGNSFSSSQQQKMTPDGRQYVHVGTINGLQVVRRVKIDAADSSVRFVDVITNTQPVDMQNVNVAFWVSTRSSFTFFGDGGDPPGQFGAASSGVVGPSRSSQTPSVAVFLASVGAKVRPSSPNLASRSVQATYLLNIPRGGSVALIHGLSQFNAVPGVVGGPVPTGYRPPPSTNPFGPSNPVATPMFASSGQPDAKALTAAMAPFRSKTFVRDLPLDVRKNLVNYVVTATDESLPNGLPLRVLNELCEQYNLTRGSEDVIVLEDEAELSGTAACGSLKVKTAYGTAEPALAEVAAVIGGGGKQRPMRTLLRNGEVLAGPIEAVNFALTTEKGLRVDLVPELMTVLVLRKSPADEQASPAGGYLTTIGGDRLAIRIGEADKLTAATPWGRTVTPLAAIESFVYEQEPQPGTQLWLRDRSKLSVVLSGSPLKLETTRWGAVTVPTAAMRRWDRVRTPAKAGDAAAAESAPDADALDEPHVRLADESVLVGDVVEPEIHIAAPGGLKTVETRLIERLERNDDGVCLCKLTDGSEFSGIVNEPILTIRAGERTLRVPTHQIAMLRGFRRAAANGPDSESPVRQEPLRLDPIRPPPSVPPTPAPPTSTRPGTLQNPFQKNPFQP